MATKHHQYVEYLRSAVESSDNLQDILPFLQMVSVTQIQIFLLDAFSQLSTNAIRKAYFNTLSIMETLPSDIVQYIESFDSDGCRTVINKQWNQCHKNNFPKLRREAINKIIFKPNILANNTWTISPNRVIQGDEARNDITSIQDALLRSKSCDKFLIHPGLYNIDYLDIQHNVHFIGVADNVRLSFYRGERSYFGWDLAQNASAYFENIINNNNSILQ
eukprot:733601_1